MADLCPLPQDTLEAFRSAQAGCRNLGLLFERYTGFSQDWSLEGKAKYETLASLAEKAKQAKREPLYRELLQQHYRRWRETVKAAGAPDDCIFEASPEWRLTVGLGRQSVLETGFTFHRIYGFPYIPGSALKGLTQAWALWQVAERLGVPALSPGVTRSDATPIQRLEAFLMEPDADERRRLLGKSRDDSAIPAEALIRTGAPEDLLLTLSDDAKTYQAVFGTQKARGRAVFFDAVPVDPPTLAVDVMNPHYGDYYKKGSRTPPADYLSPVPVYFLTVQTGSRFAFAVAAGDPGLARQACDWLRGALANLGAGGKTSAGYGYFDLPENANVEASAVTPAGAEVKPPDPPLPPVQRLKSRGQVRYDVGKVFIADANEPGLRVPVDWKALGMNALAGKTWVEYEYEELPSGKRKVVKVVKTAG